MTAARMPVLRWRRSCGCDGNGNNNQLKAEVVIATATATAGGSSDDNDGAMLDAKGGGAEVIGVGGNNNDCGVDAGSSSAAVVRLRR
jgi:hypothetical protein